MSVCAWQLVGARIEHVIPHIGDGFVGGVAAAGKIYKTVDKDGNVIFTDVPPRKDESSKTVELDSLNSYESDGTTTLRSPDGRELWIIEDETEEDP